MPISFDRAQEKLNVFKHASQSKPPEAQRGDSTGRVLAVRPGLPKKRRQLAIIEPLVSAVLKSSISNKLLEHPMTSPLRVSHRQHIKQSGSTG